MCSIARAPGRDGGGEPKTVPRGCQNGVMMQQVGRGEGLRGATARLGLGLWRE